jgi:sulfur relay (sulfurtransferase) DsrF/TusC family protein
MGLKSVVPFGKVKEYGGKESLTKRLLKKHNPVFKTANDLDAHKLHHFIEKSEKAEF